MAELSFDKFGNRVASILSSGTPANYGTADAQELGAVMADTSRMSGVSFDKKFDVQSGYGRYSRLNVISFNRGFGGTLSLGGTQNGNGALVVLNNSGGTVTTINSSGITVFNGNIVIQNSSGTNIVDPGGIISTANFPILQLFNGAANGTTASTTFVDVTGGVVGTLIFTRSTNVFFFLMGYGYNNNMILSPGEKMEVSLFDSFGTTNLMNVLVSGIATTNVTFPGPGTVNTSQNITDQLVSRDAILNLAAGTHSLKLQFQVDGGGTAKLDAFTAGYIVLGN